MRERYPDAEIVRDVRSGLNFRRKGLLALLERLHQGDKFRVVVAYRDRLARFGTGLIETLLERNGGELVVLNQRDLSREEELTTDLLAIFTVFRPPRRRTPALPQGNQGGPSSTLTPRQRAELRGWFGAARYAYNQTVELLRSEYAPPAVKAKVRDHTCRRFRPGTGALPARCWWEPSSMHAARSVLGRSGMPSLPETRAEADDRMKTSPVCASVHWSVTAESPEN